MQIKIRLLLPPVSVFVELVISIIKYQIFLHSSTQKNKTAPCFIDISILLKSFFLQKRKHFWNLKYASVFTIAQFIPALIRTMEYDCVESISKVSTLFYIFWAFLFYRPYSTFPAVFSSKGSKEELEPCFDRQRNLNPRDEMANL